jgi:hypothetical protein
MKFNNLTWVAIEGNGTIWREEGRSFLDVLEANADIASIELHDNDVCVFTVKVPPRKRPVFFRRKRLVLEDPQSSLCAVCAGWKEQEHQEGMFFFLSPDGFIGISDKIWDDWDDMFYNQKGQM